ncbi:hypothetical protein ACHAWF_000693 [Thalassiosira exigua]
MKIISLAFVSGWLSLPAYAFLHSSHARIAPASAQSVASATRTRHGPAAFARVPSRLPFAPKDDGSDDVAATGGDKPFIQPALHNSPFFRSIAILYALLFAIYQGSAQGVSRRLILSPKAAATVHLLSFATWFGTVTYTTFVSGITMFQNLPRRVFGTLQSKLFPLYFQLCSAMVGLQIITLTAMPDILSKTSEVSLAVAFVATLLNLLYLEPTSTRVMFNRYSLEDDGKRESEEYERAAKRFGKFHGMSSLANLVALCGGVVHGVRLASGLSV